MNWVGGGEWKTARHQNKPFKSNQIKMEKTVAENYEALWTSNQAAAHLAIALQTLRQWTARNKIPHYKLGKMVRYDPKKISVWLSRQETKGSLA